MLGYVAVHQPRGESLCFKIPLVFGAVSVMLTFCYFNIVCCDKLLEILFSSHHPCAASGVKLGGWGQAVCLLTCSMGVLFPQVEKRGAENTPQGAGGGASVAACLDSEA